MNFRLSRLVSNSPPGPPGVRSRSAFTLVEMLVVTVVIALLASMLLPALSRAKIRGQESRCLNNTRQLALAMFMYSADTGKTLAYKSSRYTHGVWMGTLIDYYGKTEGIRLCPAAVPSNAVPSTNYSAANGDIGTADRSWWRPVKTSSGEDKIFSGSYALNGWLYSDLAARPNSEHPEYAFVREANISKPGQTPVFMDSIWVDLWPYATDPPARDLYAGSYQPAGMGRATIARHGGAGAAAAPRSYSAAGQLPGSINMSFADGHSENVSLERLWTFLWHMHYIKPGKRPQ